MHIISKMIKIKVFPPFNFYQQQKDLAEKTRLMTWI